jgi:hypothetical protein
MAEGHNEVQGRENRPNNVINFEAERERRLLRKSRGHKDPPKHIKIITAFLNRQTRETLEGEEPIQFDVTRSGETTSQTATIAEFPSPEPQNDIALASIRAKLRLAQKEQLGDRRKWQEIAKVNGWGTNPDSPDDGYYVDRIVENAVRLGLNPHTLTPEERKDLTTHGHYIIDRAKMLGLNPLTLTPEERYDLRRLGRILTPEERKDHAEAEAKYTVRPLTPDEMNRWLAQYMGQRRNDPYTPGEVLERILEMVSRGIKAIIPPRKGKQ